MVLQLDMDNHGANRYERGLGDRRLKASPGIRHASVRQLIANSGQPNARPHFGRSP